jgi:hypothetical protein
LKENLQNFFEGLSTTPKWTYEDISSGKKINEVMKTIIDLSNTAAKQSKFRGPYLEFVFSKIHFLKFGQRIVRKILNSQQFQEKRKKRKMKRKKP